MRPIESERIFIERLFTDSVAGKKVSESKQVDIDQLTGDASTRRYYRLSADSFSFVVCLDRPFSSKEEYPFLNIQDYLQSKNIRVPKIFDFNCNSGYLLEEDLGDTTLLKHSIDFDKEAELVHYKKVIDEMIKFQSLDVNCLPEAVKQLTFDSEKLDDEVGFTIKFLFQLLLGDKFNKFSKEIEVVRSEFEKINKEIASKQMVFTHRDFHSRNIMVVNEELVIIDFQDARLGIPQYDLVSLLEDCYYQLDDSNKLNLKKYYFSHLSSFCNDQKDFAEFAINYDLTALQRVFKALGSFAFIYKQRSDDRYLKYIAYGFEKIKKILMDNDKFKPLRKNLVTIYYEN